MSLYLSPYKSLQGFTVAEDPCVRPWQAFHQCRECIVELFGERIGDPSVVGLLGYYFVVQISVMS